MQCCHDATVSKYNKNMNKTNSWRAGLRPSSSAQECETCFWWAVPGTIRHDIYQEYNFDSWLRVIPIDSLWTGGPLAGCAQVTACEWRAGSERDPRLVRGGSSHTIHSHILSYFFDSCPCLHRSSCAPRGRGTFTGLSWRTQQLPCSCNSRRKRA